MPSSNNYYPKPEALLCQCNGFPVPSSDSGWHVLLHHTGAGGWRGDHLDIVMDDGSFVRSHHITSHHITADYAAKKDCFF